jgi:hypothetical protein
VSTNQHDTVELLQNLQPDTVSNLLSHAKMFAEKPQLVQKWHCCISSPLLGQKTFSFDDFDSLRRELTKSVKKLTLGKIHIYYGYELPVTTDSTGQNLFVVNMEGYEVPITEGYDTRKPINNGEFGIPVEKLDLDKLI